MSRKAVTLRPIPSSDFGQNIATSALVPVGFKSFSIPAQNESQSEKKDDTSQRKKPKVAAFDILLDDKWDSLDTLVNYTKSQSFDHDSIQQKMHNVALIDIGEGKVGEFSDNPQAALVWFRKTMPFCNTSILSKLREDVLLDATAWVSDHLTRSEETRKFLQAKLHNLVVFKKSFQDYHLYRATFPYESFDPADVQRSKFANARDLLESFFAMYPYEAYLKKLFRDINVKEFLPTPCATKIIRVAQIDSFYFIDKLVTSFGLDNLNNFSELKQRILNVAFDPKVGENDEKRKEWEQEVIEEFFVSRMTTESSCVIKIRDLLSLSEEYSKTSLLEIYRDAKRTFNVDFVKLLMEYSRMYVYESVNSATVSLSEKRQKEVIGYVAIYTKQVFEKSTREQQLLKYEPFEVRVGNSIQSGRITEALAPLRSDNLTSFTWANAMHNILDNPVLKEIADTLKLKTQIIEDEFATYSKSYANLQKDKEAPKEEGEEDQQKGPAVPRPAKKKAAFANPFNAIQHTLHPDVVALMKFDQTEKSKEWRMVTLKLLKIDRYLKRYEFFFELIAKDTETPQTVFEFFAEKNANGELINSSKNFDFFMKPADESHSLPYHVLKVKISTERNTVIMNTGVNDRFEKDEFNSYNAEWGLNSDRTRIVFGEGEAKKTNPKEKLPEKEKTIHKTEIKIDMKAVVFAFLPKQAVTNYHKDEVKVTTVTRFYESDNEVLQPQDKIIIRMAKTGVPTDENVKKASDLREKKPDFLEIDEFMGFLTYSWTVSGKDLITWTDNVITETPFNETYVRIIFSNDLYEQGWLKPLMTPRATLAFIPVEALWDPKTMTPHENLKRKKQPENIQIEPDLSKE